MNPARVILDVSAAALLAAALLLVYWTDQKDLSTRKSVVAREIAKPEVAKTSEKIALPARLAVTPKGFDDMGKLLATFGDGYRFQVVEESALLDPTACARFDAIFLTCAEPNHLGQADSSTKLASSLRDFVHNGGTLYASDLRFDTLAAAFPELVDAASVSQGIQQNLNAQVVLPELSDLLGNEMPLRFDLDGWRPAAFIGEPVTVYLRGKFRTTAGVDIDAPLLVKFRAGKGNVLFTSFHNEKQNSTLETKLLKHLVFSTVAASIQTTVTQSMVRGGFSLQKSNLLSATPGDPSVSQKYEQAQSGGLVFTLGFERPGARLRLEVVSPRGQRFVKTGDRTLSIDLPDAAVGSWTYLATPERLPYPNFPFTLTVGAVSVADARDKMVAAPTTPGPGLVGTAKTGDVRFRLIDLGASRQAKTGLRIAVTTPKYDDMGKLLRTLGDGYRFETLSLDDLLNPTWMGRFDILFLTCDGWNDRWSGVGGNVAKFEREGVAYGTYNQDLCNSLFENIRRFVSNGGTLYASDFRYTVIAAAFPDAVLVPDELLRELDDVEKNWLTKVSPKFPIETVAQAVEQMRLSRSLSERRGQVVAALEGCMLEDAISPTFADVVKSIRMGGVSPFDADAAVIGRALRARAAKVAAADSRTRSKTHQTEIRALEKRLHELRFRVSAMCVGSGEAQVVSARVVDPGLAELLGETIDLNFDTAGWDPARFAGKDVKILMEGKFKVINGGRVEAPLLVKFPAGQGTVIFTSFHNEAQNSRQEEALLRYLVFSAVNAKEEALTDKTMLSGGFSPAKRSQISHSAGQDSVTQTYTSLKAGPIRFALTISGQGARLKFRLVAPTGHVYEQEATATLVVEATGARAGKWHYTVTSLQIPYANFPFSVGVGELAGPTPAERKP